MKHTQMRRIFDMLSIGQPSPMFCAALEQNSKHEMDWLWYADQMTDTSEELYCIERAYSLSHRPQLKARRNMLMARKFGNDHSKRNRVAYKILQSGMTR